MIAKNYYYFYLFTKNIGITLNHFLHNGSSESDEIEFSNLHPKFKPACPRIESNFMIVQTVNFLF